MSCGISHAARTANVALSRVTLRVRRAGSVTMGAEEVSIYASFVGSEGERGEHTDSSRYSRLAALVSSVGDMWKWKDTSS